MKTHALRFVTLCHMVFDLLLVARHYWAEMSGTTNRATIHLGGWHFLKKYKFEISHILCKNEKL
jgi:hypothetical protein